MHEVQVVILDNDPGACRAVERMLQHARLAPSGEAAVPVHVRAFTAAGEALQALSTQPADLLLLAHHPPALEGLDLLAKLSPREHETLVLLIAACPSLPDTVRAMRLGAFDVLAKPTTADELLEHLDQAGRHLFERRAAHRAEKEQRRVRFDFVSILAHELQSPVAAVRGYLDMITQRRLGEDMAAYDVLVAKSGERLNGMSKLIVDLLDLTRIELGRKHRTLSTVDLPELVAEVVDGVREAAQARDLRMTTKVSPECVVADSRELQCMLGNLLSNAVKYNRDGGWIDVAVTLERATLVLRVADGGIGIGPHDTGRMFEEFVRIKNAHTRGISGSGLGLAIVKKLAALYNGTVDVKSRPEEGTVFTVTLHMASVATGAGVAP